MSGLLLNLQPYDLTYNYSQVIPVDELGITDEVDPLLRLFDSHDMADIAVFDQIFATKIGAGILIVSSLDHSTSGGQWVLGALVEFAAEWSLGAPERAAALLADPLNPHLGSFPVTYMSPERLKQFAVARVNGVLGLEEGWRIRFDPHAEGEAGRWFDPATDTSSWEPIAIGGWEWQGHDYDGMAWYRIDIDAPEDWADAKLRLIADGVDDAYTVWVNGQKIATHGSFTVHEETVWQKQTVTDITAAMRPGERNTLVLQVVDITGQGGIWKPIYITAE